MNHEYVGGLICCLKCHRPASDPIHLPEVSISHIPANEPELTKSNMVTNIAAFNGSESDSDESWQASEAISVQRNAVTDSLSTLEKAVKVAENFNKIACEKGHKCPECSVIWHHDYECGRQYEALCERCAGNAAVEINRPVTIEQIAMTSSQNLTGADVVAIMLDHETLVYNMIYDSNGKEYPDWQDKINAHRRDLKQKIESFRVRELATSKVLLKKQRDDVERLSPEEREQYMRDARKRSAGKLIKEPKEPKEKKVVAVDPKAAHKNILETLIKGIKLKKPNLTQDELVARAEKQYKILCEEEAE